MSVHETEYGTFQVRYRDDNGKQQSEPFGMDKKGAEERDRQIKSRKYRNAGVNPDGERMTVGEFFEQDYMTSRKWSKNTRRRMESQWGCKDPEDDKIWHLRRKWGNVQLRAANRPQAVDVWIVEMEDAGYSRGSIRNAVVMLAQIINVAEKYECIDRSKIRGLAPSYKPGRNRDPWTPDRIERMRADCFARRAAPPRNMRGVLRERYAWGRHRDATMISVWGYCAIRVGEGLALKWPRVLNDERAGIARFLTITDKLPGISGDREDETKTRTDRVVPIEEAAREDLLWWWRANGRPTSGYVFPSQPDGTAFTQSGFATWRVKNWGPILERCGEEYREPQHLRRSCVSMWIRSNINQFTVVTWAGHSLVTLEKHYLSEIQSLQSRDPWNVSQAIAEARAALNTERPDDGHVEDPLRVADAADKKVLRIA